MQRGAAAPLVAEHGAQDKDHSIRAVVLPNKAPINNQSHPYAALSNSVPLTISARFRRSRPNPIASASSSVFAPSHAATIQTKTQPISIIDASIAPPSNYKATME
jgi:hypothetical protein